MQLCKCVYLRYEHTHTHVVAHTTTRPTDDERYANMIDEHAHFQSERHGVQKCGRRTNRFGHRHLMSNNTKLYAPLYSSYVGIRIAYDASVGRRAKQMRKCVCVYIIYDFRPAHPSLTACVCTSNTESGQRDDINVLEICKTHR